MRRGNPHLKPRWVKGQSGNPSGMTAQKAQRIRTIRELAKAYTPEALEALKAALKNKGERVRAAEVLLAYAWGKPTQKVEVDSLTLEALVLRSLGEPRAIDNSPPVVEGELAEEAAPE